MRLLALLLAATAVPAAAQVATPITAGAQDARLKQLFHDSDEASLRLMPIMALFRLSLIHI